MTEAISSSLLSQEHIIKNYGADCEKRFNIINEIRQLCEQNEYHNLVVPMARIYRDCIIESPLPLTLITTKEQIGLYIDNRERFTQAVIQFILFRKKVYSSRTFEVSLYLENGQGKIGFIDAEYFCFREYVSPLTVCRDVVGMFPLHYDEILEVGVGLKLNIERHRGALEKTRQRALANFEREYYSHDRFLKAKNITLRNPLDMIEVSKERRTQVAHMLNELPELVDFAIQFLSQCVKQNFLSKRRELLYDACPLSPDIVECINQYASDDNLVIASNILLLSLRSLRFDKKNPLAGIIQKIFIELFKGGEIANYAVTDDAHSAFV